MVRLKNFGPINIGCRKAVQGVHRYVPSQLALPLPHGNSGLQALELFAVDIL